MQYIVMVVYVLCSVSGLVFFKLGSAEKLTLAVSRTGFLVEINWMSVLGLALYVCSFLIYMGLVAKNNLSYIVPVLTGAVYIVTLISSVVVFKETIHAYQLVGSALILIGVVILNLKSKA